MVLSFISLFIKTCNCPHRTEVNHGIGHSNMAAHPSLLETLPHHTITVCTRKITINKFGPLGLVCDLDCIGLAVDITKEHK